MTAFKRGVVCPVNFFFILLIDSIDAIQNLRLYVVKRCAENLFLRIVFFSFFFFPPALNDKGERFSGGRVSDTRVSAPAKHVCVNEKIEKKRREKFYLNRPSDLNESRSKWRSVFLMVG